MKKPFLGLLMIVKNESHIICDVLNSVVKYIDTYVISDTGSTDDTVEKIQTFFNNHNIKGEIIHNEWSDFGTNRTYVLEYAQDKMQFGFMMDADDLLMTDITKREFQSMIHSTHDGYQLKITDDSGGLFYWRIQIFNMKRKWKYEGVLHEFPTIVNKSTRNTGQIDIRINSRRLGDRNKMDPKMKYQKDAEVLENALQKDPLNARYMFYLAQSYRDAEMFEKSIEWYLKRADIGQWYEEVFFSLYQVGMLYLCRLNNELLGTQYLLKAFKYYPKRTESIHMLINYLIYHKKYQIAYQYSKKIKDIELPINDGLFIENDNYRYRTKWNHFVLSLLNCEKYEHDTSIYPTEYHPTIMDIFKLYEIPILITSGSKLFGFPKEWIPKNENPKDPREKFYKVFNPSVAKNKNNEIWVNIRCSNFNQHYASMDKNEIVNTENFLCTLDFSKIYKMHDVSGFKRINNARVVGYEDVRLFYYRDRWCFMANNDEIKNHENRPQMVYGQLSKSPKSDNEWDIEYVVHLQFPRQQDCEKNWCPLLIEDELFIVYSVNPFILLKPDISTGFCMIITERKWKLSIPMFPYNDIYLRNSSPWISFNNGWLALNHLVYFVREFNHQRIYYHVFVYFSQDFSHVRYSNVFHIEKTVIEFVNGIITLPDTDEDVMISYSLNDSIPKYHTFKKSFIMSQLINTG